MEKQFVTYEIALKLKELDFDEECFAKYSIMETWADEDAISKIKSRVLYMEYENQYNIINPIWFKKDFVQDMWNDGTYWDGEHSRCELIEEDIKAPLWQQVIDWLREKYVDNIIIVPCIIPSNEIKYYIFKGKLKWDWNELYNTYEEAREQAILKAIKLCEQ